MIVSVVYAKCMYLDRRSLWSDLVSFGSLALPWLLLGDFNIIRHDGERRGGNPRLPCAMEDFSNFIDAGGLLEVPFTRNKLSWCNGQGGLARSWARLDRALCNSRYLDLFPLVSLTYLARRSSDHSPLLVGLKDRLMRYGPSVFKFQQMWTSHDDFWRIVSLVWQEGSYGSGLSSLAIKLKRLKIALRCWNKDVFGWTGAHIKRLEERVEEGETQLQEHYSVDVETDVLATKLELSSWLKREETRIAQKVKKTWIEHGEVNSTFFAALQVRNHFNIQNMKLNDGRFLSSPEAIHEEAVHYFEEFL
ncbi:hypothetical protein F2P56_012700 [Juglans regia]|uniref:Uncharacterized protein n=2 Tax=Juglans regia TaxID=51240 RepID=A0A833XJ06_JUGRE|nr:uncharacterized protein LOC108994529 [Juglans regia]KAF5468557.1 hypothetical protein F2P56_012700 [Juglans regia]